MYWEDDSVSQGNAVAKSIVLAMNAGELRYLQLCCKQRKLQGDTIPASMHCDTR